MAKTRYLVLLPDARRVSAGRMRRRAVVALALWVAAAACRAAPPDLTSMSLEELMEVQLPPLAATARFQVSAMAVDSCVVNATDLSFGTYDPLQPTPADASSALTVTCTVDSGYSVALDAGIGAGATVMARKLTGPDGSSLDYGLYRDAGRALVWGNSAGSDTVAGVGTGAPANHLVYGRIPPGQPAKRGMYVDIITVTVNY